jgi:Protein of unknown function (DUF998)
MNKSLTFWTGILGTVIFVLTTIVGGVLSPDYSHITQFISESYAIDTLHGKELRYIGFIPSGILLAIFGFSASLHFPKSTSTRIGFWGLAIFYGLATIVVSIFPCDKGCNKELIDPSISQLIHNLTGSLTYILVPLSMILIGVGLWKSQPEKIISRLAIATGVTCILFISLLIADSETNLTGLFQRIIEGAILLWIVVCSIRVKNKI